MITCTHSAFAMQEQVFSLAKNEVNTSWTAYNDLSAVSEDDGVTMSAKQTGVFLATVKIEPTAQTAIVTTTSTKDQTINFVWVKGKNVESGQWYRMQLTVRAGHSVTTAIALHTLDGWANDADFIGIELPEGTALKLENIRLVHASGLEQLQEAFLSFWTFDTYRPYSINFGWGPQIAATTPERLTMFDSLPPHALSATYLLYGVMIAAFLIVLLVAYTIVSVQTRRRFLVTGLLSVLAVSWIVMDARMGSEFLSWMWKDYHQYIAAPVETRTFRDRGRFYDFAEFVTPLVADRQHYVFFAEVPWPYLGNIGYITYPALPSDKLDANDTWVVYHRDDIRQNATGELESGGQVVSGPGTILGRFDSSSFVFRLSSPPPLQ